MDELIYTTLLGLYRVVPNKIRHQMCIQLQHQLCTLLTNGVAWKTHNSAKYAFQIHEHDSETCHSHKAIHHK